MSVPIYLWSGTTTNNAYAVWGAAATWIATFTQTNQSYYIDDLPVEYPKYTIVHKEDVIFAIQEYITEVIEGSIDLDYYKISHVLTNLTKALNFILSNDRNKEKTYILTANEAADLHGRIYIVGDIESFR